MVYRQVFSDVVTAILNQERGAKWIVILAAVMGAGLTVMLVLHPGILLFPFEVVKAVVVTIWQVAVAIWDMVSDFAAACGQFLRWAMQQK